MSNAEGVKTEGVVLAAGLSSRTGVYKLTLKVNGKTIIENCIDGLYDICSKVIVVVGHNYDIVSKLLSIYPKVELVYNTNYLDGMFSSVKEGIKHVTAEKFFLIPGDYPLISSKTYMKLIYSEDDIVIPMYHGRNGHPVFMRKSIIPYIINKSEYTNLKEVINAYGFTAIDTNDPGILLDVDTIEDYNYIISSEGI